MEEKKIKEEKIMRKKKKIMEEEKKIKEKKVVGVNRYNVV